MSTTLEGRTGTGLAARIIGEGYGTGAWHGPDLKAALTDVTGEVAFWRPGPNRHNIAEVALHHAYCVRNVRAKLTGIEAGPFVLDGDDWFALSDASRLSWEAIIDIVEREHGQLSAIAADLDAGRMRSALADSERLDLLLGITCHAVYHAGQVQLVKKLKIDR